ncbi:heparinase II/III domain-containing protein [Psychrobacillus psychrodurans]|uniref:Heparinase II/III family protein n=1 Tax=Psychrobacillus psychrodurans TaxID=126157 RepID=A0A9X3L5Z0_9BACI|nr:heparinase II/III family protein [Psychrobacillus psychrodurans]MCZ8531965.1 heparinase II/III family protein [Psychrobacillus psychrodurans]
MKFAQHLKRLKPHPRILFNDEELKEMKARVADNKLGSGINFNNAWYKMLELAESYVDEKEFMIVYPSCSVQLTFPLPLIQLEPVGDPPGYIDYPFWTMYSRAIEERISVLSFAYGITKDKRFAEKVKEYLLALSSFTRWFEFPLRGAEGNLSNAHFTIGAAIGYDAILHTLSSTEKDMIKHAILTKGLQPFRIDFNNHDSHNIIASKQVAMLIGSLAILESDCKDEVEPFIFNSCTYISNYLNSRLKNPDIEGLLYLNVAARHILMAVDTYHRSTGNNEFLQHLYFSFLPDLFIYSLGTGGKLSFVNFSDSFYSLDISYLMSILASKNQNRIASWYMNKFSESHLETLLHTNNLPEPLDPERYYGNRCSNIFSTIGWASLRSGWKDHDHLLAFNSSQSAKNHNHFDQNNFILHVAGEWLISNPGYQDYVEGPRRDFTIGTIGHNSMLVNNKGQSQLGKSKFVDWYTSEYYSFVSGEAAGAYDKSISQWVRKIVHIDNSYYLVIDKVVKEDKDSVLSFLFHTTAQIYAGDKNLLPGEKTEETHITFVGNNVSASIYNCYPKCTKKSVEQHKEAEEYGSYLKIVPQDKEQLQYLMTMLVPEASKNEFAYSVNRVESQFHLEIARQGITDHILVNENRDSVWQTSTNGEIVLQGEQGWISFQNDDSKLSKFSIVNGSCLKVQSDYIFQTSEDMNISAQFNDIGAKIQLELQKNTQISLKTPQPTILLVNNEEHLINYQIDQGMLELYLEQGLNEIELFI